MANGDLKPTPTGEIPASLRRPQGRPGMPEGQADTSALRQRHNLPPIAVDTSDPVVYLSKEQEKLSQANWPTLSQAKYDYATSKPKVMNALFSIADKYYGKGQWDIDYLEGLWDRALKINVAELKKGNRIPALEVFDKLFEQAAAAGIALGGKGGGGGSPDITKSISLTDPQTAETLIDQALQQYLGRKASNAEIEDFRKSLTRAEKKAPVEVNVVGGDTSVRSGGFNPAVFAQQYAEGMKGAAEYQAATTFLDAFIGAIRPRVEL